MQPVLEYQRPLLSRPPVMSRFWRFIKPLVVGFPLVVLLGVGTGLLVYALNLPGPNSPPHAINDWNYNRRMEDRAIVMGIGAGMLVGGAITALLYLIRFAHDIFRPRTGEGGPAGEGTIAFPPSPPPAFPSESRPPSDTL